LEVNPVGSVVVVGAMVVVVAGDDDETAAAVVAVVDGAPVVTVEVSSPHAATSSDRTTSRIDFFIDAPVV
jgi:hypothetical protein